MKISRILLLSGLLILPVITQSKEQETFIQKIKSTACRYYERPWIKKAFWIAGTSAVILGGIYLLSSETRDLAKSLLVGGVIVATTANNDTKTPANTQNSTQPNKPDSTTISKTPESTTPSTNTPGSTNGPKVTVTQEQLDGTPSKEYEAHFTHNGQKIDQTPPNTENTETGSNPTKELGAKAPILNNTINNGTSSGTNPKELPKPGEQATGKNTDESSQPNITEQPGLETTGDKQNPAPKKPLLADLGFAAHPNNNLPKKQPTKDDLLDQLTDNAARVLGN